MLPGYVMQILIDKFGQERANVMAQNWYRFVDIRFSESTKREIINAGKMVEECLGIVNLRYKRVIRRLNGIAGWVTPLGSLNDLNAILPTDQKVASSRCHLV